MYLLEKLYLLVEYLNNRVATLQKTDVENYLEKLRLQTNTEFISLYLFDSSYHLQYTTNSFVGQINLNNPLIKKVFLKKNAIIASAPQIFHNIVLIFKDYKCNIYPLFFNNTNLGLVILFFKNKMNEELKWFADLAVRYLAQIIYGKTDVLLNGQSGDNAADTIFFENPIMQKNIEIIKNIAPTKINVLLTGESGAGKELMARYIHKLSDRKEYPFITVSCSAIPSTLIESELFGVKKGAFTGALADRKGKFLLADKGTVFLDDVSELSENVQMKLLRVLQERKIQPLGDVEEQLIDVRIIAATREPLEKLISSKKIREDLFFRLNGIVINIPPLRERREDLPLLINYFLNKYNVAYSKNIKIPNDILKKMFKNEWRGNVRELQNYIERLVVLSDENEIVENLNLYASVDRKITNSTELDELLKIQESNNITLSEAEYLFKKWFLKMQLSKNNFNITNTAKKINVQRTYLSKLVKDYKLK